MKKCSKCKVEKEESNFSKERACKDGLHRYCKTCSEISRKNRIKKVQAKNLFSFDSTRTKICVSCGKEKIAANFYRSTSALDGLFSKCIDCESIYQKQLLAVNTGKRTGLSRIKNLNSSWLKGLIRYKKLDTPNKFLCAMDGCTNQSNVYHHIRYDSRSTEQPLSIIAPLCKDCHYFFHIKEREGVDLTDKILTQIELEYVPYKKPHITYLKERV